MDIQLDEIFDDIKMIFEFMFELESIFIFSSMPEEVLPFWDTLYFCKLIEFLSKYSDQVERIQVMRKKMTQQEKDRIDKWVLENLEFSKQYKKKQQQERNGFK